VSCCAAATTNPYNIVLPWFRMQLGKLGLGETGFFGGTRRASRAIRSYFFAVWEVEKRNGA